MEASRAAVEEVDLDLRDGEEQTLEDIARIAHTAHIGHGHNRR